MKLNRSVFSLGAQGGGDKGAEVWMAKRCLSLAMLEMPQVPYHEKYQAIGFVLRIDGFLQTFGIDGYGGLRFNGRGNGIDFEIGLPEHVYRSKSTEEIFELLSTYIEEGLRDLETKAEKKRVSFDFERIMNDWAIIRASAASKIKLES